MEDESFPKTKHTKTPPKLKKSQIPASQTKKPRMMN